MFEEVTKTDAFLVNFVNPNYWKSVEMEDCVTDGQSLRLSLNLNPEDGSNREDNGEKATGFVSKGQVAEETEEKIDGEANGGGGLISNLISSLVTPLSPRTGGVAEQHGNGNRVPESQAFAAGAGSDDRGGGTENGEEGRGLISNLISNFFHQNEGLVVKNEKDDEDQQGKTEEEEDQQRETEEESNGGGGGIIDNIASHLPSSLPGNQKQRIPEVEPFRHFLLHFIHLR